MSERREVAFVTRVLTHYRVPFHEAVRARLGAQGVDYRLLVGRPTRAEADKGDLAELPWDEPVPQFALPGGRLVWQRLGGRVARSNLVILGQENGLLANYALQLGRHGKRKVALFGHGRNFQSRRPDGLAERWKRFWATRCDWWFAYTDETRRHVEALGFATERITVFNNAIDTRELEAALASLTPAEVAAARAEVGLGEGPVGLFVGGLYPDKRLEFLVAAGERVREQVPGFQLLAIGAGESLPVLQTLARERPWLVLAGPRFGRDKAALMRSASLFLMPGLVGLAVLDAGVAGLPAVTTAWPWHSPEIAYLEDGENAVIVPEWESLEAYAEAVAALLADEPRRARLAANAAASARAYTIEAMAERFAGGVLRALDRACPPCPARSRAATRSP